MTAEMMANIAANITKKKKNNQSIFPNRLRHPLRRALKGAAVFMLSGLLCISSLPKPGLEPGTFSPAFRVFRAGLPQAAVSDSSQPSTGCTRLFAAAPAYAADISSAYETMKSQYPEYLATMQQNGASEAEIKSFVEDLNSALSTKSLTPDNFDRTLINTSISLLFKNEHSDVAAALLAGYSGYIGDIKTGTVPEPLRPLRNTLYNLLMSSSGGGAGGGGGGGGGGGISQQTQQPQAASFKEVSHELGTALVDAAAKAVALAVELDKIAPRLEAEGRETVIALSAVSAGNASGDASRAAVTLPAEVLSKARERNKTLVIDGGAVKLGLPPGFLKVSAGSGSSSATVNAAANTAASASSGSASLAGASAAAGAPSAVTVQIEKLDSMSEAVVLIEPKTAAKGLVPQSAVYDFKMYLNEVSGSQSAVSPGSGSASAGSASANSGAAGANPASASGTLISKFDLPVTVSIALPSVNSSGAGNSSNAGSSTSSSTAANALSDSAQAYDREKLGIYRFDPTSGQWQYVGGRLADGGGQISAQLTSFSRYAVMEYKKHFPDLPASHWASRDVEIMAARHVVEGMPGGKFEPEAKVTRAQFAALVQRSLGLKSSGGDPGLKDVAPGAWYREAVAAAAEAGIITGYEDKTFRPDQVINRQEMAVMVMRAARWAKSASSVNANSSVGANFSTSTATAASAAGSYSPSAVTATGVLTGSAANTASAASAQTAALLSQFADAREISAWAQAAVAAAVEAGLIQGRSSEGPAGSIRKFVPGGTATRAEATVILKRLLQHAGLY